MLRRMVFAFALVGLCTSLVSAQDQERRRGQGRGQGQGQGQGRGMQGGPGMGGPMMLLGIEDVRKELKLDDGQIKKFEEVASKQREMMRDFRDMSPEERREKMQEITKEVTGILNADQQKRLKQLQYQSQGIVAALGTEEVRKEIGLSEDQQSQVRSINEDMRAQQREMFQGGGGGGDRQEMMRKMEEMRKSTETKVMGVLNDTQKAKWKEMQGEPFKGNLRPQMPRRGGVIG